MRVARPSGELCTLLPAYNPVKQLVPSSACPTTPLTCWRSEPARGGGWILEVLRTGLSQ